MQNDTPYLTEGALTTLDGLALKGRETVLIKATYPEALEPRQTIDEIPCYGDRLGVPVEDEPGRFTVRMPDTDNDADLAAGPEVV